MSVEIITTERRTARKRRRCTWCGEWIGIDGTYIHERVKVDGHMGTNKLHPECAQALNKLAAYEGGSCTYTPYDNARPTVASESGSVMKRDAVISECERYRYRLYREWEASERMPVMWLMLNPSTADASIDDPTIRRCIAFSKAWGYGAMWVGNLYAIRSPDPSILTTLSPDEARGPDNRRHVELMSQQSAFVVCAWGAAAGSHLPQWVRSPGGLWCLGTTKHGAPRHPLYVAGSTLRQPFPTKAGDTP